MKNIHIPILVTLFILMLASTFVLASFSQPAENISTFSVQSKLILPQTTDLSEIGSTTGIFIMGVVIVLIVSLPLIFRKKKH